MRAYAIDPAPVVSESCAAFVPLFTVVDCTPTTPPAAAVTVVHALIVPDSKPSVKSDAAWAGAIAAAPSATSAMAARARGRLKERRKDRGVGIEGDYHSTYIRLSRNQVILGALSHPLCVPT